MHHITAPCSYNTSTLFEKAIPQSPAYQPVTNTQQTERYNKTLSWASSFTNRSITSLSQLEQLPFNVLYDVNAALVASSEYGTFTFGPVVDGRYVPALPGQRLLEGKFDHKISTIASRNADEGKLFTSTSIQNNAAFNDLVRSLLPEASSETITYITTHLYPPIFNGSYPYTTQIERGQLITQEFTITCHSYFLANAFAKAEAERVSRSWKYIFAVPPGLHSNDVSYTFFNGDTHPQSIGNIVVNTTVAGVLQNMIINLAQRATPNGKGVPEFPSYGDGRVFDLNFTMLGNVFPDPDDNERCKYWQGSSWHQGMSE